MPRKKHSLATQEVLFSLTNHNAESQHASKNPFSVDLAKRILKKSKGTKTLAARKQKEHSKKTAQPENEHYFDFMGLPFDLQEYTLRFLPARALCLCPLICKAWSHVYEGAVASIFSGVVGVARGRTRLVRQAELRLIHCMRHTCEPDNAVEMLLWAAFNGHSRYCLDLLKRHHAILSPNHPGSEDWDCATVLHVAARQGNASLVDLLLHRGADPAALTKQRRTPLIVAAEYNQCQVVQVLLRRCKERVKVDAADATGRTALFVACEKGFHQVVYAILDECAALRTAHPEAAAGWGAFPDVDLGTAEWGSPLCVACKSGYQKIAGKLLDSGAAVNICTGDGRCPLFIAAERAAINTTRIILRLRPPVTEPRLAELFFQSDPQQGRAAAAAAASTAGEVPGVEPGEAGTIVDLATSAGKTALFAASEKGLDKVVEVLIESGANVSKPTFLNKTPLYAATENGHAAVVKRLLRFCTREDVVRETNFGTTALFMAQRNGNRAIKNLLTEFCLANVSKEKAGERKKCKGQQSAAMSRLTVQKDSKQVKVEDFTSIDRRVELDVKQSKEEIKKLSEGIALLENLSMSAMSAAQINFDEDGNIIPRQDRAVSGARKQVGVAGETREWQDESNGRERDLEGQGTAETGEMEAQRTVEVEGQRIAETVDMEGQRTAESVEMEGQRTAESVEMEGQETTNTARVESQRITESNVARDITPTMGRAEQGDTPCDHEEADQNSSSRPESEGSDVQSSESRNIVCRKERDLIEARIIDAEQNSTAEDLRREDEMTSDGPLGHPSSEKSNIPGGWARKLVAGLPLNTLKRSLVEFSEATSDYRLDEELIRRVWFLDDVRAKRIMSHFSGNSRPAGSPTESGGHVNAWELFVVSALFSSSPQVQRLRFCFNLFDLSRTGSLTRSSLTNLIRCCQNGLSKLLGKGSKPETPRDTEFWVKTILDNSGQRNQQSDDPINNVANDSEKSVPFQSFLNWVTDNSEVDNIFQEAERARELLLVSGK